MGTKYSRMFKIDWLMARIRAGAAQGKIVEEKSLVGEFCIFHSSTERTCQEILGNLEHSKRIVRDYGEIWTPEAYHIQKADEELQKITSKVNSGEET